MDKFQPVTRRGEVDHSKEAIGQLIVSGSDGAVDLKVAEHAFYAVALLAPSGRSLQLHWTTDSGREVLEPDGLHLRAGILSLNVAFWSTSAP